MPIIYKKIQSSDVVVEYLVGLIGGKLAKAQKVLWLVAGGSALAVAKQVAQRLNQNSNLTNLTVTLTDERYGRVGHNDSNWRQLLHDKAFSLPGARLLPVLDGSNLETAASRFGELLKQNLKVCDYSIALGGIGADGHIFGIKPNSPAISSQHDVVGYVGEDYIRITPTIKLIKQINEVVFYVVGSDKHQPIADIGRDLNADEQPAQLLKQLPNVVIFNDYKGEAI